MDIIRIMVDFWIFCIKQQDLKSPDDAGSERAEGAAWL